MSTSLWILLLVCPSLVRVMIVFLLLWIVLVGLLSLFLVRLVWMLLSVVGYFLSIGFVFMGCQVRLLVIGMLSLLLSFGRNCASCCNVGWHLVQLIIHRLMVLLSVSIAQLSRFYVVIAVVSRSCGLVICSSVLLP